MATETASGPGPGRVIRIGSAGDNDVVLEDPVVSQHHARIDFGPSGAMIEDLGSTNGTYLGARERRIARAPLAEADTVYFDSVAAPAR